jgi:hypothetical protein
VEMAWQCKGRVADVGMAWLPALAKRSDFDFYHTNRAQPNADQGFEPQGLVANRFT